MMWEVWEWDEQYIQGKLLKKYKKKEDTLRNKEVKALLFDKYLRQTDNMKRGDQSITDFFAAHN